MSPHETTRAAPLTLGSAITRTPEKAVAREWLITNGLGDYGCGTVAGPTTRRGHGLFTMAGGPDRAPMVLLSELDVALVVGDQRHELSCHQFADSRHPDGFKHCAEFKAHPYPEWRYEIDGLILRYRLFMAQYRRIVVAAWTLEATPQATDNAARLEVRPLLAYREADALTEANDAADMTLHWHDDSFSVRPYEGCPEFFFHHDAVNVKADPCWYYRLQHSWDLALGRPAREDLFCPATLTFHLTPGTPVALSAGLTPDAPDARDMERAERNRADTLTLPAMDDAPHAPLLAKAAAEFAIKGDDERAYLLAKYPNPTSDLRAALIAMPGLLLCTRRLDEARQVLDFALEQLQPLGRGQPLDDTPLWFIRAAELYVDHSRDWDYLRDTLTPAAMEIAQRYINGDRGNGFALDSDGLLISTNPGQALTWMDATIEGWPVTPRTGKPVEVNALWHHIMGLLIRWSRRKGDKTAEQQCIRLHDHGGRSFRLRFWNEELKGLYDVIDQPDGTASAAIRPNQIFAVALPTDLLDRHHANGVIRLVENRLLTPLGLRSLSLEDAAFQPHYSGDDDSRASARHQGCVYPWLLGAYADAIFRVRGRTNSAYGRVEACVSTLLEDHLLEGCLGQISALFQGASPHQPRSAPASAPALGELIRVYAEIKGRLW
jgi:predicted glycogen debranching enzyme